MTEHKEHIVSVKTYLGIITSLMVLTAITVVVAFFDFGLMNNVAALGIAAVKALLVAAIFMHLRYAARINWLFAGSGIVFFIILIAFVLGDYAGRPWQHRPEPWEAPPAAATAHHP